MAHRLRTTPVVRALRQATSSIPIVVAAVNDPVEQGFVSSLAHPGGNITGFTFIDFQMVGKWLEMLKEAAPALSRAGLMFNPDMSPHYYVYLRSFEAVPRSIAVEVAAAPVRDTTEVEEAFAKFGRDPGAGLIVPPDRSPLSITNCSSGWRSSTECRRCTPFGHMSRKAP